MKLVIVESPTKAKTIGKFLGSDYEIKASMGHIMDLPKSKLGVGVEHNFKPEFVVSPDKKNIISELKSSAKHADSIVLATDPDREGEAIAAHIAEVLEETKETEETKGKKKLSVSSGSSKPFVSSLKRIVFHEITQEAIEDALKHPRSIDQNLVNAQTARRVLDRLVGYKLSPMLWQKVRRGLSAGRVQSVALRLIVEREREIEKFKKEQYYTIHAFLLKETNEPEGTEETEGQARLPAPEGAADGGQEFELVEINGKKIEQQEKFELYDGEYSTTKTIIDTEEKAKQIISDLKNKDFIVADISQKEMKRSPLPPYTTSTLQQDAARRLGLSGKRTMSLAQKLYEEGYITYHRTDSLTMSQGAQGAIIGFVKKEYGEKYVKARNYKTKQKLAQEAHEAIRPTKIPVSGQVVSQDLGASFGKLYDLIWKRAVASQMSDAITESTTVMVHVQKGSIAPALPSRGRSFQNDKPLYVLKANGSVLLFDGFLKVNPQALNDNRLPEFTKDEHLTLQKVEDVPHESAPPPRYNEASLIKTLEEKGIGRPSTYATIVSTIQDRQYVEREENKFKPTNVGNAVNDFLVENFGEIDDIPFTAQMEDDLDDIAHGKKEWVPMIKAFYDPLSKKLGEAKKVERVQIETEKTDQICEKCGAPMVVRIGRFGKFLSCSRFPECDFKKPFIEETKFMCPKDNGKIIVRKTRKGRKFYGCSKYPKCDFAAWNLNDVKK